MDPTTLIAGALVALGLLTADIVIYSGSVVVEIAAPPKTEKMEIDQTIVQGEFSALITAITAEKSVVSTPEVTWSRQQGAALILATALNLDKISYGLQVQAGFTPDRLRLAFYLDDGTLHALVGGMSHKWGPFGQALGMNKDEPLAGFVRRAILSGVSQLAPYATALHLLRVHSQDQDFTDVIALVEHGKALLPHTPTSFDRSLFENLLGLIALFKHDLPAAAGAFDEAMAADPTNPVPFINAAFVDLEVDECRRAASRMEELLRLAPPDNHLLLGSAYMTWAAAAMCMNDLADANELLARAIEVDPTSATAFGLWADEKRLEGDTKAAAELQYRAQENEVTVEETYAEIAALYFHLSWENNQPVQTSPYFTPAAVRFR